MDKETFIHAEFLMQTLAKEGRNQSQIDAALSKFGRIVEAKHSPELAFTTIYNSFGATENVESKLLTIKSLIQDELKEASSKYKVRGAKTILADKVAKFNSMIGKIEFRFVHGGKTYGLSEQDEKELIVEIPRALRDRERLAESFASSGVKNRIKQLDVTVTL